MKSILIIFMTISSCFVYGQQLLTPYNGVLSTVAQQALQYYQADTSLIFAGTYQMSARPLRDSSVMVNLGNYSFNFFLDIKGEIAMSSFWNGTSMFGDKISILHKGSSGSMTITSSTFQVIEVHHLDGNIHGVFNKINLVDTTNDCSNEVVDIPIEDDVEEVKSGDSETHCPVRIGMSITSDVYDSYPTRSALMETVNKRIKQTNEAYIASRTGDLFGGISVDLAYVRVLPTYNELDDDGVIKKESRIMTEFTALSNLPASQANVTRKYYGADFCGLVYLTNDVKKTSGGMALWGNGPLSAFFILDDGRMRADERLTFTHEIGHLFGCVHDYNNDWLIQTANHGHGYFSIAEGWHTIMSYQQDDAYGEPATYRVAVHSNPFLSSLVLSSPPPEVSDIAPSGFLNQLVGEPMGGELFGFCMNLIAINYKKRINYEVTDYDKTGTTIKTVVTPIFSSPASDRFTIFADLLAVNTITFSDASEITNGYGRTIRAGQFIEIDGSDGFTTFDAQNGSEVDMTIIEFADSGDDCEPNSWRPIKNGDKSILSLSDDLDKKSEFLIYPNPTHGLSNIEFNLKEDCTVNIWVVDGLGRTVKILCEERLYLKGSYKETFDFGNLHNGYYRVFLTKCNKRYSQPLLIAR